MNLILNAGNTTDYLQAHRAWGRNCPGKDTGFTLPDFQTGQFHQLPLSDSEALQRRGIRFNQPVTSGNLTIWLGHRAQSIDMSINASAGSTGFIAIDGPGHCSGEISLHANDHVYILGPSAHGRNMKTNLWGTGTAFFFGVGGSINSATLLVEGDHVSMQIGDDAMLADGIDITTSDSHGIFEVDNPAALVNAPANVIIHRHVWLGKFAAIGKGRSIGAGAIIGQRSVVTADVPPKTVAAGSPARIVREGVTWTRPWPYDRNAIQQAIDIIDQP